jgi:hypothetical protein
MKPHEGNQVQFQHKSLATGCLLGNHAAAYFSTPQVGGRGGTAAMPESGTILPGRKIAVASS